MRKKYAVECPICGHRFESYEEFFRHVSSTHPESLEARFRAKIVKLEA